MARRLVDIGDRKRWRYKTGSGNNRCRATLAAMSSVAYLSWAFVANVGVDIEIASPYLFRSKVISTSVLCRRHFAFTMSADVGHVVSGISESGMVENVGIAAKIASPSLSVQKLFLLPVCVVAIFAFSMSVDVGPCHQWHFRIGLGRKCGESRWYHVAISFHSKFYFLLSVSSLPFWIPAAVAIVGVHARC